MSYDELLNYYYPSPTPSMPQYVTKAPPMPPQQELPNFMNPPAQQQSVGQSGGGGGGEFGAGDIIKFLPTLATIFGL